METGKLIINLDVLFVNDLVMTLILLWATAKFAEVPVRFWRLVVSGIVGALYTVVLVLPFFRELPMGTYLGFHVVLNLLVATLMIRVAFTSLRWKKFLKTLGYFYLITFLAGGAALSIYFISGSSPTSWIFSWADLSNSYLALCLVAGVVALVVGRYGWQLVREKLYKQEYHLTFRIWIDEQFVEIQGLMDTGNKLKDPVTQMPVIVVESAVLAEMMPAEVQAVLADRSMDVIDQVENLLHTAWFKRFRIIPFSSVGNDGGLMIGCKPDRVEIIGEEIREVKRVILGLHQGQLNLEGDYQALLHPELLEARVG